MKPKINMTLIIFEIIGLFFYIYLFASILNFRSENSNNLFLSGLYLVELGIHEISHLLTMFLPAIITSMAGSISEVGFTLILLFEAIRKKAYFAAAFVCQWVMLSMSSAGRYISDARSQLIPLVGFTENPTHDWQYALSTFNILEYDTLIGGMVRGLGIIIGVVGLALAVIIIVRQVTYFPPQNEKILQ